MKPVHIWAVKLANPNVYGGSPQIYLLVLEAIVTIHITPYIYGRFLEWWIPQNHGCFNTKVTKDGLIWMIWGYHHFRKPPYIYIYINIQNPYSYWSYNPNLDNSYHLVDDV